VLEEVLEPNLAQQLLPVDELLDESVRRLGDRE
jgi:hypothetical protein